MRQYRHNKLKTAWEIFRRVENWPAAVDLRLRRQRPGLRLLRFHDGFNIILRGGTRDWDVVHELLFAGGYQRAFNFLHESLGKPCVLDLGGNIGLFSLLAARSNTNARIVAYEPGPPNQRLFEMNRLANPNYADRIDLQTEAVAGHTRTARWRFDELNPGGSSLYGHTGKEFPIQIRAFAEVIASLPQPIRLLKLDIEGSEFEVLAQTPSEIWQRIGAVALELHDDPQKKESRTDFLHRMAALGFIIEEESVCSYFLHR